MAAERRTPLRVARPLIDEKDADGEAAARVPSTGDSVATPREFRPPSDVPEMARLVELAEGEIEWFADAGCWNRLATSSRPRCQNATMPWAASIVSC